MVCAILIIATTIDAESGSFTISLIKNISIFRLSIGNLFKYANDEYPVPKSSIEISL